MSLISQIKFLKNINCFHKHKYYLFHYKLYFCALIHCCENIKTYVLIHLLTFT